MIGNLIDPAELFAEVIQAVSADDLALTRFARKYQSRS